FADFVALAWSGGAELEPAFEEAPGLAFTRGLLVEDLGFDADSAAVVFAEGALADRLLVGGCWFGSAGFGWRFRVGFGGVSGSVGCSGGIFVHPVAINNSIDLIGA